MEAQRLTRQSNSRRDFKSHLKSELIRRCGENRKYSLRSFAKDLGVNHATLSSVLSGKRSLTRKSILKMAAALELSSSDLQKFLAELNTPERVRKSKPLDHEHLALDAFHAIAFWYHDAILELTHTEQFQADFSWIAKALGITRLEATDAVERLLRLELLAIRRSGVWVDLSRNNTTNTSPDLTSSALRALQKKLLEKSIMALQSVPRPLRDHTSTAFAINLRDLPEIKKRIAEFRFQLAGFVQRPDTKFDSVYQLSLSLFPLTTFQENT